MRRPRTETKPFRIPTWIFGVVAAAIAIAGAIFAWTYFAPNDGKLVLHTAKGDYTFFVEIADTELKREYGLMNRYSLAPDAGMLFDYHREQQASFWMKDTYIPLDMVFIAADGTVKTIHVNARPKDLSSIPSEVPIRFVLEIPGGRSVEIGLKPGDRMEHPRVGSAG